MVIVPMVPHVEFERNDHVENAPYFIWRSFFENDWKTIHSPSFRQSIETKLDKVEIYASEEIVQSYFG